MMCFIYYVKVKKFCPWTCFCWGSPIANVCSFPWGRRVWFLQRQILLPLTWRGIPCCNLASWGERWKVHHPNADSVQHPHVPQLPWSLSSVPEICLERPVPSGPTCPIYGTSHSPASPRMWMASQHFPHHPHTLPPQLFSSFFISLMVNLVFSVSFSSLYGMMFKKRRGEKYLYRAMLKL